MSLCARYQSKVTTWALGAKQPSWGGLLKHSLKMRNKGTEQLCDLSKVTQLLRVSVKIYPQFYLTP